MAELRAAIESFLSVDLFGLGDARVTVGSLFIFGATLVFAAWVSRVVQRILRTVLTARGATDDGTIAAISRLVHYAILIVGAAVALETLGFDLTALLAAGAILGLGLGLAMQSIVQNFLSGVILLIEQSITPGDVLSIDGRVVRVEHMRIRTTIARTWDDDEIIIPNSTLAQSTVINYTLTDSLYRIRTKVGVAYGSDLDETARVLTAAAASLEGISSVKEPVAQLHDFGDSSIVFDVSIWVDDPWGARVRRSDLNFAIWRALKEHDITIAFPQLDVHFDRLPNAEAGPA